MRPIARELAGRYDGTVTLVEVDSSKDSVSSSTHRVRGVPTFVAIKDDSEVGRAVGSRSPAQLDALFQAASTGHSLSGQISSTDRGLRLGVGAVFAGAALVTTTPLLLMFAAAAVVFATWDLIRP
jgi:hypothetical protein